MKKYNSGNTNTLLIVVVLVILVGFGVWWFTMRSAAPADDGGIDVNVDLPSGDGGGGTSGGGGGAPY